MDKKRILRRGIAMLLSVILLLGGCPVLSLAEAPILSFRGRGPFPLVKVRRFCYNGRKRGTET